MKRLFTILMLFVVTATMAQVDITPNFKCVGWLDNEFITVNYEEGQERATVFNHTSGKVSRVDTSEAQEMCSKVTSERLTLDLTPSFYCEGFDGDVFTYITYNEGAEVAELEEHIDGEMFISTITIEDATERCSKMNKKE